MPADLVGGSYHLEDPVWKMVGKPVNETQANVAARSNLWATKLSKLADTVLAASGVGNVIAVPVQYGDVITKISLLIGAGAGEEVKEGYAALYTGAKSGALLGQSKGATITVTASKRLTFTLESPVMITPTNAPSGWVYVVVSVECGAEAGGPPSAIGVAVPKATQYEWFTGTPEILAGTAGTGLKVKAESTLGAVTSAATVPLVFLR